MTNELDPHAVLGVSSTASPQEVARAYRALVRRHHPDARAGSGGAAEEAAHDHSLRRVMAAYALIAASDRARDRGHVYRAARSSSPAAHYSDPPVLIGTFSSPSSSQYSWLIDREDRLFD